MAENETMWDLGTCPLCGGKMWWFGGNYACKDCHNMVIRSYPIELDKPRRSENEEMQEVANRDAFYGESLND